MKQHELSVAMRETAEIMAEDTFFSCRPKELDSAHSRRMFMAGFERGWEAVCPIYPRGLTDAQIDEIAESMPGGLDGFLKQWGWRQFARAIEEQHGFPLGVSDIDK